nr:uncharacterized protein LOC123771840 [Procambarus clarkii]
MLISKLVFLQLMMLLVTVETRADGVSSGRRPPVRVYAGVNTPEQAVLIQLNNATTSQRLANSAALQTQGTERVAARPSHAAGQNDKSITAAHRQKTSIGAPGLYPRPFSRSGAAVEKLRQQMQGRTAGSWRHAVGGLDNSRLRPGMSRLGAGDVLAKRRRHHLPSSPGVGQTRTGHGAPGTRHSLHSAAGFPSSTPQSKMDDFISEWHNFYSRSQTKEEDVVSIDKGPSTESTSKSENLKHEPVTSTPLPVYSHNRSDVRKLIENSSPLRTQSPGPTVLTSVPSLHDMTSMHFKFNRSSSSSHVSALGTQSETSKGRKSKSPARQPTRTRGNPLILATAIMTTPSSIRHSATTKASPDGKEIFDSIQSIFEAAKTDERALSSMKNVNHGNTSPQSLDIFSGVSPTYGFQPSLQAESLIRSTIDNHAQQIQTNSVPPTATHSVALITSQRPFVSEPDAQASNSIPSSVLLSGRPAGGDLLLQLGHTLPVQAREQTWGPEHRDAGEEDIIHNEGLTNDVIIGRPAALIQAPPETAPIVSSAAPLPQRHSGNPVYFRNTEEITTQRAPEQYSSPPWHPEELSPLLQFINTKYKPQHLNTNPSSVTSLQSMIHAGRIPEVFRRNQVMDIIREDRLRYEPQSVDRVGKPLRNAVERTHTHPKEKGVSSGGQFVAVSSIALLLAFCGYFLYAGSAAKEARKVLHPLKTAVDEARNGLHFLLRGLDEYEDHLSKEEENKNLKRQHIQEHTTTQSHIPTILKKMWNTVVPPEVRISSGIVKLDAEGYRPVNASALIRSNKPRRRTTTSSRQPHAITVPTGHKYSEDKFDLSQHKPSTVQTVIGLSSVANSFLNYLINSKAVESIISQLKSSTVSTHNPNTPRMEPRGEEKQSSPNQIENKPALKIQDETASKDRNHPNDDISQSTPHAAPQSSQATTSSPNDREDKTTNSFWSQDGLVTFAGTGLSLAGLGGVTEQSSPASKRVIINNRLHIPHHPETDPPRTSAFVNNIPLKPAL